MGQAKQRGTFEERKAAAKPRKKRPSKHTINSIAAGVLMEYLKTAFTRKKKEKEPSHE